MMTDFNNLNFWTNSLQAIAVMAGFWPLTPHPTLLPGGQGSVAPM